MPVALTETRIDYTQDRVKPLLNDLQGNILKGHGRDHTFSVFVRFKADRKAAARDWISAFTGTFVPSAARQLEQTDFFKTHRVSAGMFANFFLTASGYRFFDTPDAKIPGPPNSPYRKGMKQSQAALHDPAPATWEPGFDADIHAMILIADDSPQLVRAMKRAIIISLKDIGIVLREEPGRALRNADGNGIEHNGYADGVSQPLFFKQDLDKEKANLAAEGGFSVWNPEAPLNLALVRDPGGKTTESYGSFLVFRKLEQNVKLFKQKEAELAQELDLTDPELAGAMVVGRFEDGTPVTMANVAHQPAKDKVPNNFTYTNDTGGRCPFHGHIRKTNPRSDHPAGIFPDETTADLFNRSKRIVRRGIPFENQPRVMTPEGEFDENHLPTGGVGLLFMCFVADIANQFEFMQQTWVNNEGFVKNGVGIDPIIGQHNGTFGQQSWPTSWSGATNKPFQFADAVTMKGGAYFFAPSLSYLKGLKVNGNPGLPPALQIFV